MFPHQEFEAGADVPLEGIRVLDLSRLVAGNMVTHMLADYGAEVIKVERPGAGDDLRNWRTEGVSTHWKTYCRNKKSLTLNLRSEAGQVLLLELVDTAQVLVENFRPGTLEDWGIGPVVLQKRNPKLSIVRVSGWGQDGIYKHKPGFGSLVEAMSGFAAMNGFEDRPPVLPPLAMADMVAGLYGAFSVMVAIRNIEMSGGDGQVIDLPLFDPFLSILGPQAANYRLKGTIAPRNGSLSNQSAPRNVYRCKDGRYVALSASMQSMAEKTLKTIGREDLITDPRFRTNTDRVANNDQLDPIVAEFMASHSQAEILDIFDEAGVTVGPVCDIDQLTDHPYIEDRAVIVDLPDKETGRFPMHNVSPRMSGTPGKIRNPAPELGEHNTEILRALGYSDVDIERMQGEGTV